MRIAAEAADHVGVLLAPTRAASSSPVSSRERAEQRERALLRGGILGMLERHVQEPALEGVELAVEAARRRRPRAVASARASPANARGVSRKMLRVNWSSSRTRASAPCGVAHHSPNAPASATATASPKRSRISRRTRRPCGTRRRARACGARAEPERESHAASAGRPCAYDSGTSPRAAAVAPRPARPSMRMPHFATATSSCSPAARRCCSPTRPGLITMNGAGRLLARATQGARDARRDDVRARLGARDDADVAVDGAASAAAAGFMAGALDQHRRLRCSARSRCGSTASCCSASRPRSSASTTRSACSTGSPRRRSRRRRDRAKAISLVLAGGIVGGFLGPAIDALGQGSASPTPFARLVPGARRVALVALAVQSRVHVPPPSLEERSGGGRPLREIVRQPVFVVAALSGALGYGLMNLLMTATPLAMDFCGHPYAQAALVIEWHVVGMYAPGFVTGSLIKRFGVLTMIVAGVALMAAGVAVALDGDTVAHFLVALVLRRRRLELHVHRRHDAADRDLHARREGAHAGRQRLRSCSRRWRMSSFVVRRAGVVGRLGDDERGALPILARGRGGRAVALRQRRARAAGAVAMSQPCAASTRLVCAERPCRLQRRGRVARRGVRDRISCNYARRRSAPAAIAGERVAQHRQRRAEHGPTAGTRALPRPRRRGFVQRRMPCDEDAAAARGTSRLFRRSPGPSSARARSRRCACRVCARTSPQAVAAVGAREVAARRRRA